MAIEEIDDVDLVEDGEEGKEAPFRRRPKTVSVRRGRGARWRRILRWGLVLTLLLVPAGYGVYRLAAFASTSQDFALTSADEVVLTGNQFVSKEEALNALGLPSAGRLSPGMNIFKMSMEEKRRQLESIPWVEKATLTRIYPNRLAVHLEERTPVAFVNFGSQIKLVDHNGVLLEKPARAQFNFPVVTGLDLAGGPSERARRLAVYLDFMRAVSQQAAAAGWVVSEVDLADAEDLKAMMAAHQDTIQLHMGNGSFSERFGNFLTLLPELKKAGQPVDSVDLRFGQQIVVNPKKGLDLPPGAIPEPPAHLREN